MGASGEVAGGTAGGAAGSRAGRAAPRVSVVMANWRGERFLGEAVASVLRQTEESLELLVADDGSDDGSEGAAREAAGGDERLRWLPGRVRGGPGAARNRALDAARGAWVAVMDSDDLLHPRRLELLLLLAEAEGADLVADDLLHFGGGAARTLLGPLLPDAPFAVDAARWVRSNTAGGGPPLGYLKPLIRRSALGAARYDPSLRVGEDYDLVLRLLLAGARLLVTPLPLYLYRRHPGSISHRLTAGAVEAMLAAHRPQAAAAEGRALRSALARRGRGLERLLRFERLVEALKAQHVGKAAAVVARDPRLVLALGRSAGEGLRRRLAARAVRSAAATGAPLRLALLPSGGRLPEGADLGAGEDGVVEAPPLDVRRGAALRRLALRLGDAAGGPVALTAVGAAALDAAWLLPDPVVREVWLAEGEAARSPLPPGAVLRRT